MHVVYHIYRNVVVFTSAEQTSNNPLQYFPYLDLVCEMSLHLHYISSISPCFSYLVTYYVLRRVFSVLVSIYVWMSAGKGIKRLPKEEWLSRSFQANPKCSPLTLFLSVIWVFKCKWLNEYVENGLNPDFRGLKTAYNSQILLIVHSDPEFRWAEEWGKDRDPKSGHIMTCYVPSFPLF